MQVSLFSDSFCIFCIYELLSNLTKVPFEPFRQSLYAYNFLITRIVILASLLPICLLLVISHSTIPIFRHW